MIHAKGIFYNDVEVYSEEATDIQQVLSVEPNGVVPENACLGICQIDWGVVPESVSLGHSLIDCGATNRQTDDALP